MTTSWLGFKGVEELGGGLRAEMALTAFLRPDTGEAGRFFGDKLFSRDANIALSGAFAARSWANAAAGDSGWSNQVIYSAPDFDGLSANLYYQFGEKAGDTGSKNIGLNALYFHGPLALSAFYHKVQVSNPDGGAALVDATAAPLNFAAIDSQRAYFIGASYDLNAAKLYATYSSSRDESAAALTLDDQTYSLGVKAPAGNGDVLLAYAHTRRSGSLAGSELKRATAALGYDYNLSRRTDLYAIAMSDKLGSAGRATSVAAGIRHKF